MPALFDRSDRVLVGQAVTTVAMARRTAKDLAEFTIVADQPGGRVTQFVHAQPEWWHRGIWKFSAPDEPNLWLLSPAADEVLKAWEQQP